MKTSVTSTPDFDITVKLRNNHLVSHRESLGWGAAEFAEHISVDYAKYIELESMRVSPLRKDGTWRIVALKIARFMAVEPEEVWPNIVLLVKDPKVFLKASKEQVAAVFPSLLTETSLPPSPDEYIENSELEDAVRNKLSSFSEKEQRAVILRFGLDGGEMRTFAAVGEIMGTSAAKANERCRKVLFNLMKDRTLLEHHGDISLVEKNDAILKQVKEWRDQWEEEQRLKSRNKLLRLNYL